MSEVIEQLWSNYDKDGSGSLSKEEAAKLLNDAFGESNKDKVDKFMSEADADKSGAISKEELVSWWNS